MGDNRGKGPNTPGNDGRIERNPSRPYENRQGGSGKDPRKDTKDKVDKILKK
ncbi:hypothetical protein [Candidatus Thiosymbion oneisti]|uniref:hypothetical protein n=1 Tax=Candidatus Thiosymbion oneisti TaxID=589554 RepID=UPI00159F25A1|nr:hypothetical protein [Candidatus Thiosymbion oneisti]